MGRRFVGNNFLYIAPRHAKGLRCRSCNKALLSQAARREYEEKKRENPNFEVENNIFPWRTNLSITDNFMEPNVDIQQLQNYLNLITTSYGVPNLMKVFQTDIKHSAPSDAVIQFHLNFQWHSLNCPNVYDMRFWVELT